DVETDQEVTSAAPATIDQVAPGAASYSTAATVVVNSNINWDLGVSGTSVTVPNQHINTP
ncbi:MAG TPA: hypothetical protein VIJ25_09675, partial [Methylococcales bacterium]